MPAKGAPRKPPPDNRSAVAKERRARGRIERATLRYKFSLYTPPEAIADPLTHLENKRGAYISRLEEIMDASVLDPKLAAQIAVKLLQFSSVGKVRTDIGETLAKLMREPDLTGFSPAMLDRIISGETVDVPQLDAPESFAIDRDDSDSTRKP